MFKYDVIKGTWHGNGRAYYDRNSLTAEARTDIINTVKDAVKHIWFCTDTYYTDRGIWPQTIVELESRNYTQLDPGVTAQWQFAFIGSPPEKIIAISKEIMPAGAGHAIEYDIKTESFRGFGIP